MEFHAIIREEDGSYWAEVEELPGCFASGQDLDELKDALIEAIQMCVTPADALKLAKVEPMRPAVLTVATGPLVPA